MLKKRKLLSENSSFLKATFYSIIPFHNLLATCNAVGRSFSSITKKLLGSRP